MSSGCGDVLTLEDLKTAKKHQVFEAEVITGKSGGVASGANIDYATNQVTGQVQKTMPAVLRDIGFTPVSWDFSTGGTLGVGDRDKVVYDPVSKAWYSYAGSLPVTVPAGFNPVGNADWTPQTDPTIREDLLTNGKNMVGGLGYVTVDQFRNPSDPDDTLAFNAALAEGQPIVLDGSHTYSIDYSAIALTGLQDTTIFGNGATIRIVGGDIGFKSPKNVKIMDVNFVGDGDKRQRIWVSNYEWFYFIRCSFKSFHQSTLQADTTVVFMYAGDNTNTLIAAGDSSHGRLIDCSFEGDRLTMFGCRVYTEFQTAETAVNFDTKIVGGSFNGFMWNAVEIAGPNTISCGVEGATAYNNGLAPFDMDKGCRKCFVRDVFIDKLTGLPSPFDVSTRIQAINIQGTLPQGILASDNIVDGVQVRLYKSDLDAATVDAAIITMADVKNSQVRNVNVEVIGGLPVSSSSKMGLAVSAFSDIEGCTVSDISCTNASHGMIEVGASSLVGMSANIWRKISVNGTGVGEVIGVANNHSIAVRHYFEDISMSTVLQQPKFSEGVSLNFKNTNTNSYIDLNRVSVEQSTNFVIKAGVSKLGMRNCTFRHTTLTVSSLIQSSNSLTWLNICNDIFNSSPVYWDTALASVTGSYSVSTQLNRVEFNQFNKIPGSTVWVDTNGPVNPSAANWPAAQILNRFNFTTSNGAQLINFGSTWRGFGTLI